MQCVTSIVSRCHSRNPKNWLHCPNKEAQKFHLATVPTPHPTLLPRGCHRLGCLPFHMSEGSWRRSSSFGGGRSAEDAAMLPFSHSNQKASAIEQCEVTQRKQEDAGELCLGAVLQALRNWLEQIQENLWAASMLTFCNENSIYPQYFERHTLKLSSVRPNHRKEQEKASPLDKNRGVTFWQFFGSVTVSHM